MKIADVFLDGEKLDNGVRLYLEDRNGKPIDEWISVLYVHSDAAQAAMAKAMRTDAEAGKLSKDDGDLLKRYSWTLVSAWSFEDDLNEENIKALFANAPDIRNRIVWYSEQKRLFFPQPVESSSTGPKKKSS